MNRKWQGVNLVDVDADVLLAEQAPFQKVSVSSFFLQKRYFHEIRSFSSKYSLQMRTAG